MNDQLAWTSLRPAGSISIGLRLCDVRSSVFGRPGGISGEPVPDPIPNSAVKLPSANGTESQDLEESVAARPAKDGNLFTIKNPREARVSREAKSRRGICRGGFCIFGAG